MGFQVRFLKLVQLAQKQGRTAYDGTNAFTAVLLVKRAQRRTIPGCWSCL
jgi:hypothetical protein